MTVQVPPIRAELHKSFERSTSKQLMALRDRLAGMPETHEPAEGEGEPDPAMVYSKADPRWARMHEAVVKELESRAQSALKSAQGGAGRGKVRGPSR